MEFEETTGPGLREYAGVVRRHKWLIIAVTILAAVGAYLYSQSKTPIYQANAELMYEQPIDISRSLVNQAADPAQIAIEVESVGNVIQSPDVKKRASEIAGFDVSGYNLSAKAVATSGQTSGSASMVWITVISPDAAKSAKVANAVADAFIGWRRDNEIAQIQKAQDAIRRELAEYTTPEQQKLADYVNLSDRLLDLELMKSAATGDFTRIVPATAPDTPISPNPKRAAMLGLGAGLILALGAAFLLEQFDTRLRSHREVSDILRMPTVGRIPRIAPASLKDGPLVALTDPEGAAAEALRVLRSNLEFFSVDEHVRSIVLVSAHKDEGKTLTICNLAVTLALSGRKVVLIDADMRRPRVHQAFNLPNDIGLSNVLSGQSTLVDALQPFTSPGMQAASGNGSRPDSSTPNGDNAPLLYVLTAGPPPPNPGEMVASRRFETMVGEFNDSTADFVLVDSPAFGSVGDAAALAADVDALMLLVNIESATRPEIEESREFLEPLPCRKLGIVAVSERFTGGDYYHRH